MQGYNQHCMPHKQEHKIAHTLTTAKARRYGDLELQATRCLHKLCLYRSAIKQDNKGVSVTSTPLKGCQKLAARCKEKR